jgi:tetratricopeptide (TPR) repeat protein
MRAHPFAVSALLVAATLAAFGGVTRNEFVAFDDDVYVTENPVVAEGLSLGGVAWALTATDASNWHPLTWLSHMLDVELFGMEAAAHHGVSLALHAANGVILFLLLSSLTSAPGRSAFVAGLFLLHPMHVESVAWVAERKDVLSTFFWLLATAAWTRWAREASRAGYAAALGLFALGLASKPMLVTFPFVLLLLDAWPLRRSRFVSGPEGLPLGRLIVEKLPFLALATLSCVVTVAAQGAGGAVRDLEAFSLGTRIATALVAWCAYPMALAWPVDLAVFYPYPRGWPVWQVASSGALLTAVTALAIAALRSRPWIGAGWLWYLGTLVPVIGLVQVGNQWIADRYTYVPAIGLFVLLAWGACDLAGSGRRARQALAVCGVAVLGLCATATRAQVDYWRDTPTLFEHALAVTRANYVALSTLGTVSAKKGDLDRAVKRYLMALAINPDYQAARYNLAMAMVLQNRFDAALAHLRLLLEQRPSDPEVHFLLGDVAQRLGDLGAAAVHWGDGLALAPDRADGWTQLGAIELRLGRIDRAVSALKRAVALDPGAARARSLLERAEARAGDRPD